MISLVYDLIEPCVSDEVQLHEFFESPMFVLNKIVCIHGTVYYLEVKG